jgi:peptide/nickel transport system substrate-binding protein
VVRQPRRGRGQGRRRGRLPLKRPQPAFIALIASGFTRSIPATSRRPRCGGRPVGTGPFRFVEFKPNEVIRVARNKDYWKKDRPYLDGIEWKIMKKQARPACWPSSPARST